VFLVRMIHLGIAVHHSSLSLPVIILIIKSFCQCTFASFLLIIMFRCLDVSLLSLIFGSAIFALLKNYR
jgi:hypothetical protein